MGEEEDAFLYERRLSEAAVLQRKKPPAPEPTPRGTGNSVKEAYERHVREREAALLYAQAATRLERSYDNTERLLYQGDSRMEGEPSLPRPKPPRRSPQEEMAALARNARNAQQQAQQRLDEQIETALGMMTATEVAKVRELIAQGANPVSAIKSVLGIRSPTAAMLQHTAGVSGQVPASAGLHDQPLVKEGAGVTVWINPAVLSVDGIRYEVTARQAARIAALNPEQRKAFHEKMGNAAELQQSIADQMEHLHNTLVSTPSNIAPLAEAAAVKAAEVEQAKKRVRPKVWRVVEKDRKGEPKRAVSPDKTVTLGRVRSAGVKECERCESTIPRGKFYGQLLRYDRPKNIGGRSVPTEENYHVGCLPAWHDEGAVLVGLRAK